MNFTSQVCTTKEQSERLLSVGLKKETADMLYMQIDGYWVCVISQGDEEYIPYEDHLPAWSLHRLKCLLSEKTPYGNDYLTVEIINENVYIVLVIEDVEQRVLKYTKGNLYDNLISCINFFVKEGLFNKEYLE